MASAMVLGFSQHARDGVLRSETLVAALTLGDVFDDADEHAGHALGARTSPRRWCFPT